MDAKKFGAFIAQTRKERQMTQAELAGKLQVTDKAVSKWERGAGFPDIQMLEPLAEALGISLVELMRSEKNPEGGLAQDEVGQVLAETLDLGGRQKAAALKRGAILTMGGLTGILIVLYGFWLSVHRTASFAVIGGADGPTSVFVAGKISYSLIAAVIGAGALVILLTLIYWRRGKR